MSGWRHEPFDAVVADESGGNIKTPQSEFLPTGRYAIVDQGKELVAGYTDDESRLCRAQLPVIVFGDHTRCFKYVDFPFCMGADGVKVLRPKIDGDVKYLYHYLRQLRLTEGGYDRHFKYLRRSSIVLPPLPEQRRIAELLDRAEALRAKRRAALAQLDTLTQAIFLDMFGDPATNPKKWLMVPLRDLVSEFRYGTSTKSGLHGKPALRIPNVVDGNIDVSDLKLVPLEPREFERLRLVDGDVLFVRTNGNPDFVGRCAVFDRTSVVTSGLPTDAFVFASYLIRARLHTDQVTPAFLREFMLGPEGRRRLRARSKTSAGQFNINTESLGAIPVPVPAHSLQTDFAHRIAAVEHLKGSNRASLAELDTLFASLQHRAFRGEL
jgi:type I restriction enzyme S subunit